MKVVAIRLGFHKTYDGDRLSHTTVNCEPVYQQADGKLVTWCDESLFGLTSRPSDPSTPLDSRSLMRSMKAIDPINFDAVMEACEQHLPPEHQVRWVGGNPSAARARSRALAAQDPTACALIEIKNSEYGFVEPWRNSPKEDWKCYDPDRDTKGQIYYTGNVDLLDTELGQAALNCENRVKPDLGDRAVRQSHKYRVHAKKTGWKFGKKTKRKICMRYVLRDGHNIIKATVYKQGNPIEKFLWPVHPDHETQHKRQDLGYLIKTVGFSNLAAFQDGLALLGQARAADCKKIYLAGSALLGAFVVNLSRMANALHLVKADVKAESRVESDELPAAQNAAPVEPTVKVSSVLKADNTAPIAADELLLTNILPDVIEARKPAVPTQPAAAEKQPAKVLVTQKKVVIAAVGIGATLLAIKYLSQASNNMQKPARPTVPLQHKPVLVAAA